MTTTLLDAVDAVSIESIETMFDRIETAPGSGGTLARSLTQHIGRSDWRATLNGTQDPLVIARFWSKVAVGRPTKCWPWIATVNRSGYGQFSVKNRLVTASRFAYAVIHGEIPPGLDVDHVCRNRACVNPSHLEAVTHAENIRRRPMPTHCPKGHNFTDENTRQRATGGRVCIACTKERIPCPTCGKPISRKNMSQHRRYCRS